MPRSPLHGHGGAHGNGVAQADGALGVGHADAHVTLTAVELRGLMGLVAQRRQHRSGGGQEVVLARGAGQLGEPGAQDETSLGVPGHQAVELQRDRDAVRRGAGQVGGGHELGQGCRARLQRAHHQGRLVDHADAAAVVLKGAVHTLILAFQGMRFQVKVDVGSGTVSASRGRGWSRRPQEWRGRLSWSVRGSGDAREPGAVAISCF